MTTYVKPRAKEAPVKRLPHCLCTMLETMLACVCELIMMPSRRMTSAGMGLVEKEYDSGSWRVASSSRLFWG